MENNFVKTEFMELPLKMYLLRPGKGESKDLREPKAFHFAVGSVLGDGAISQRDYCLEIEQASPTFALWKRNLAEKFGLVKPKYPRSKKILKLANGKIAINLPLTWKFSKKKKSPLVKSEPVPVRRPFSRGFSFTTRPFFHEDWRNTFYVKKVTHRGKPITKNVRNQYRKRIPPNIKDYLYDNLALGIWFFDDGWFNWEKNTVCLSTGEWTREECELMRQCLKENFNLDVIIYPLTGQPHHFHVKKHSYPEFYKRVLPLYEEFVQAHPRYAQNTNMRNKVLMKPK